MGKKRISGEDGYDDGAVPDDDEDTGLDGEQLAVDYEINAERGDITETMRAIRERRESGKRLRPRDVIDEEDATSRKLRLDEIKNERDAITADFQKQRDLYEDRGEYNKVAAIDETLGQIDASALHSVREVQVAYSVPWLKRVSGTIQSKLEESYIADELLPKEIKYRVLTYVGGTLGVDSELTLSVEQDPDGAPKRVGNKVLTVHGPLEQSVLDDARSGLYVETAVQANIDLLRKLGENYQSELEELFRKEKQLIFEPKQRKDLTDML